MNYILAFLEGIITFISPCLLPMIPVYISFFTGQKAASKNNIIKNAIGFVFGFTFVFTILGAFAGAIGGLLSSYQTVFNVICGIILILFGLNFIGIFSLPFINNVYNVKSPKTVTGFFSAIILGIIFSLSWMPCVGTFLGSALILAASAGERLMGISLLFLYSLGLGVPFIISAIFIENLDNFFNSIKKHYKTITIVSGALLIVLGILIATGLMNYVYTWI